jgi:esterase/lipase
MTTPPPRFGVLLLHGFTGNPETMRPLQAPLEALGLEVRRRCCEATGHLRRKR